MIDTSSINLEQGNVVRLSSLKIGQSGKVMKININNKKIKNHLLEMGMVRGTMVTVKKVAPLGDPVSIELRGYELSMRKSELAQIEVKI